MYSIFLYTKINLSRIHACFLKKEGNNMKKVIKVFSMFVFVSSLLFFSSFAINAENNPESSMNSEPQNSAIIPYGRICSCGGTFYLASTTYGAWYNSSEVKCNSHTYGTDIIQKRDVSKTYRCGSCGKGYTTHSTESRRICHGYDN